MLTRRFLGRLGSPTKASAMSPGDHPAPPLRFVSCQGHLLVLPPASSLLGSHPGPHEPIPAHPCRASAWPMEGTQETLGGRGARAQGSSAGLSGSARSAWRRQPPPHHPKRMLPSLGPSSGLVSLDSEGALGFSPRLGQTIREVCYVTGDDAAFTDGDTQVARRRAWPLSKEAGCPSGEPHAIGTHTVFRMHPKGLTALLIDCNALFFDHLNCSARKACLCRSCLA